MLWDLHRQQIFFEEFNRHQAPNEFTRNEPMHDLVEILLQRRFIMPAGTNRRRRITLLLFVYSLAEGEIRHFVHARTAAGSSEWPTITSKQEGGGRGGGYGAEERAYVCFADCNIQ